MNVEIEHNLSEDRLSRELYKFRIITGYICLMSFHQQTRKTTRHKFVGPMWDHSDERSYHSKLSRPTSIPDEVIAKARQAWADAIREVPVFIGWTNEQSRLK